MHVLTLIDTPGYPDFVGQAIGALDAVETVASRDQCLGGHRADDRAG